MAGAAYQLQPEHQHLAIEALRTYAEQLRLRGPNSDAQPILDASAAAAEDLADRIDRHLSELWAAHRR
jgi:hypothetical protein